MRTIDREELQVRIDRNDDFKLVMALPDWAYQASHIPGSLHFDNKAALLANLEQTETIVVYCSNPACVASQYAYHELERAGFTDVARYEGGLSDWAAAGLPLEGTEHG